MRERFFQFKKGVNLSEIVELCSIDSDFIDFEILGLTTLDKAQEGEITFFHNAKYKDLIKSSKASACFIKKEHVVYLPSHIIPLVTEKPYWCLAQSLKMLYQPFEKDLKVLIDPSAKVGKNCKISSSAIIGPEAEIGDGCEIGPFTFIGPRVVLGKNAKIASHVSIQKSVIGDNIFIKEGAKIGQQGFGFEMEGDQCIEIPHVGCVCIGSNVQIGSNTTIDRGSISETIIEDGCQIDNLVQIAHNVHIGKNTIIVAQTGIAGSVEIGSYVQIGGQTGVAGHLKIGDSVKIAAKSGVMRDIPDSHVVAGAPALEITEFFKQVAVIKKLAKKER